MSGPEREHPTADGYPTQRELIDFAPYLDAGPGPDPAHPNRRRFDRVEFQKMVHVTELDDFGNPASSWECRVVDLSRCGLGLRSRRMVHHGRGLLIEVQGLPGQPGRVLFGVVRQSRYAEGEGYAVGLEFKSIPHTTPVRAWLSQRGLAA